MSTKEPSTDAANAGSSPLIAGGTTRREFVRSASALLGTVAIGAELASCAPDAAPASRAHASPSRRNVSLDRDRMVTLASAVLPSTLGQDGQSSAVDAFLTWVGEYEPVAEEMHGYGYADIRYLPPDPAPAWRAQLDGLDLLAQRTHKVRSFAECGAEQRQAVLNTALRTARGDRLPSPLNAPHVAIALLSHWASGSEAWDEALGVRIGRNTCRPLSETSDVPVAIARRAT